MGVLHRIAPPPDQDLLRCGENQYEYENHVEATRYEKYNASQHTVTTCCSVCNSELDTGTRESHSFSYGSWASYSGTQHRRTKSCPDCGYSSYDYGSHSDGNGDGRCDVCSQQHVRHRDLGRRDQRRHGERPRGQRHHLRRLREHGHRTQSDPGKGRPQISRAGTTSASGGSLYNTVTVSAARTFYAQFTAESYTVTWDLGDGDTETTSQTYGQALVLPATPSRDGYTFQGWYTSETGGTQVTGSTTYTTAWALYLLRPVGSRPVHHHLGPGGWQDGDHPADLWGKAGAAHPASEGRLPTPSWAGSLTRREGSR